MAGKCERLAATQFRHKCTQQKCDTFKNTRNGRACHFLIEMYMNLVFKSGHLMRLLMEKIVSEF